MQAQEMLNHLLQRQVQSLPEETQTMDTTREQLSPLAQRVSSGVHKITSVVSNGPMPFPLIAGMLSAIIDQSVDKVPDDKLYSMLDWIVQEITHWRDGEDTQISATTDES